MACNSYVWQSVADKSISNQKGISKLWQSVADKSISNQKGISKQTVGLDIGYQMTATKKKDVSNMVCGIKKAGQKNEVSKLLLC